MWNMLSGLINEIHVGTCRWQGQGTKTEETSWSDGSILPADTFQAGGSGIFIWVLSAGADMKFVVLKINFVCVTSSVTVNVTRIFLTTMYSCLFVCNDPVKISWLNKKMCHRSRTASERLDEHVTHVNFLVQGRWFVMPSQRFHRPVESMPRWIDVVIRAKGGATWY